MADNTDRYNSHRDENWRMGNKGTEHQKRYGYRGHDEREWDEGNYFHTGPSPKGAQDTTKQKYGENYQHDRNRTYAQGRNAHLKDHYGSRPNSPYRNEHSYLDHGDQYQHSQEHNMRRPHAPGDYLQNRSYDRNEQRGNEWREGPSSRSRYKNDDFRYGSGSHNWYTEGRYTADENRGPHDQRGFFDKVKDTWSDIWHSDDPEYQPHNRYESRAERINPAVRHGAEDYRNRNFDKGYEGGPRWADDSDSGRDNYYKDSDRTQRYRR
jgi:hypothetical protein